MRRVALLFAAPFLGLALCILIPLLGWLVIPYFAWKGTQETLSRLRRHPTMGRHTNRS